MARKYRIHLESAQEVVATLGQRYPDLTIRSEPSGGDWDWTIPVQPGIRHEILIYVLHDEIYFDVGAFHSSHFPCDEEIPRAMFIDHVTGFIDGRYRVREHFRRGICIAADLQESRQGEWRSIASWSCLHWPFPRKKEFRMVQNVE